MKIKWDHKDTWTCSSCEGDTFIVLKVTSDWLDYICANCETEDTMLFNDFVEWMVLEAYEWSGRESD